MKIRIWYISIHIITAGEEISVGSTAIGDSWCDRQEDGTVVNVNVGEDEDDPVVYITDLLIHLAGKQLQKKAAEVIEGENLDILIGSRPLKEEKDKKKKEAVKNNVLRILGEKIWCRGRGFSFRRAGDRSGGQSS